MKATCQLCGVEVEGINPELIATMRAADGLVTNSSLLQVPPDRFVALIEYDSLSAHMWLHISDHHRDQTEEGILCQRRAAKMYAMNWATVEDTPAMAELKTQWRSEMLIKLATTTLVENQTVTPEPEAGEYVKNSSRNF